MGPSETLGPVGVGEMLFSPEKHGTLIIAVGNITDSGSLAKYIRKQKAVTLILYVSCTMNYTIELELELDGRWLAEVINLPGVLTYGDTREEAISKAQALALRVEAEKLENGERSSFETGIFFEAA